jgi:hypothetical protein
MILGISPTESVTRVVDNPLATPMFALPGSVLRRHCERGDKNETQAGLHMIDTEVVRLRQLRATALKARALAAAMNSSSTRGATIFTRSTVSCWRIARLVTGRLRAHPYLSYQRDASVTRAVFDRVNAHLVASLSQRQGQAYRTFAAELKRLAREVDNARSLTLSPDLSDSLGRSQTEIRDLIKEADAGARKETGSFNETVSRIDAGGIAVRNDGAAVEGSWPYLAF